MWSRGPVLVSGGGVAGLTLARCLKQRSVPVRVLEDAIAPPAGGCDRGLGLWPSSTAVLRSVLGASQLDALAHSTQAAAYRGVDGVWLSGGSGYKHVRTVRQTALLQTLASSLAPHELCYGARVQRTSLGEADVRSGGEGRSGAWVELVDGTVEQGSFVVDATGAATLDSSGTWTTQHYSAMSALPVAVPQAFETLGDGRRFAVVPLGESSSFWFASFPLNDALLPEPDRLASAPPHAADDTEVYAVLREAFGSWHSPIPELIEAGAAAAVLGTTPPPPRLLREKSGWLQRRTPAASAGHTGCYVGDARAAMPANLAQGAAMAIEEAAELASALAHHGPTDGVAVAAFTASRRRRVLCCGGGTLFTSLLAAPRAPTLCTARDALLRFGVHRLLFDATLWLSLGAGYRAPTA
jgi:2-polyprenyl-6-methoxyphenol hydroxylase-like FAD-dependent oxidoreductase